MKKGSVAWGVVKQVKKKRKKKTRKGTLLKRTAGKRTGSPKPASTVGQLTTCGLEDRW